MRTVIPRQVYSACLVATVGGGHTFGDTRSIQLRILTSQSLDGRERELARVVYTRVRIVPSMSTSQYRTVL